MSYSDLGRRTSVDGHGALSTTHQGRGHRRNATRQGPRRAILNAIEAATPCDVEYGFNFERGTMRDVEEPTARR
jgi:hypothetical protein